MKIAVIGLGSMGTRRIRLIKRYNPNYQIFGIDTSEERRERCREEQNITVFSDLSSLLDNHSMDCSFVCTAPLSHSNIIAQCLKEGIHVFSELNLTPERYCENIDLADRNNLVLFMSSTFLYRKEIQKIDSLVKKADCLLNYIYHIGQYLPDWHPWENYEDFFVSDKRTNACREIFAIELPWLIHVFGEIENISVVKDKISSLNIGYEDNFFVVVQHRDGHKGMLAVDIVSRKAVRNLEIFGENLFLRWDGSPKGLKRYDCENRVEESISLYDEIEQLDQYSQFVIENAYFDEIVSFFASINGDQTPLYSFQQDKQVLELIDCIEA